MQPIEVTPIAFLTQDVFILGEEKVGHQISTSQHCRTTLDRKVDSFYLECKDQIYNLQETKGVLKGFKKIVVKNILKEFAQLLSQEIKTALNDPDIIKNLELVWTMTLAGSVQEQQNRSYKQRFINKVLGFLEEIHNIDHIKLIRNLHLDTISTLFEDVLPLKISAAMLMRISRNCGHLMPNVAEKYETFIKEASSGHGSSLDQLLNICDAVADSLLPKMLKGAISREYSDLFDLFFNSHCAKF